MLVDLTEENFGDETEKNRWMILDFWAPWCGPCRAFAPIFEEASKRHPDVLFGRIDTESQTELAKQFGIFSVPTLITAKDGTIVYARPGTVNPAKLEDLIRELKA